MLRKYASLAVLDAWQVPARPGPASLRKTAHRVDFEYTPRPGYLYVRSRAISSRANDNHDEFPAAEIEKSYKTFLGKPVFVNHHNANHRRARGVIVAVALHRDRNPDGTPDTWAEVLQEIDARRFPKLAQAILAGRVDRTSMGVDVEESQCTACGNKATDPAQYCRHLPALKGQKIRRRGSDGKLREEIIREICRGLSFFENSLLVEEPADPTAYVLGTPDDRGLKMTAAALPKSLRFRFMHASETMSGSHELTAHVPGRDKPVGEIKWHPASGAVDLVGTHPSYQGRGLATHLWNRAHEISAERGFPFPRHTGSEPGDAPGVQTPEGAQWARHAPNPGYVHGQEPMIPRQRGNQTRDIRPELIDPAATDMAEHMISDHGFYDSASRIRASDPEAVAAMHDAQHAGPVRRPHRHAALPPHVNWDAVTGLQHVVPVTFSGDSSEPYEFPMGSPHTHDVCRDHLPSVMSLPEGEARIHPENPRRGTCVYCGRGPEGIIGNPQNLDVPSREGGGTYPYSQRHLPEMLRQLGEGQHDLSPYDPHNPKFDYHSGIDQRLPYRMNSLRREAITGEEAEPGHSIWAVPNGESPAADEVYQNMHTREPGEHGEGWYKGTAYHGPYHIIRHPETRSTHVVDARGRDTRPGSPGGYGNWERDGNWGESAAEDHWRGLESVGPDHARTGTHEDPSYALQKERTPAFPHSRIDPEDLRRAERPDARVHKPEGHSPEDEWHGPYEVVRHPETSRFHVVDNAGRVAPHGWQGHPTQMGAERSRDYTDRRQQSKDRAKGIAGAMWEGMQQVFDPGSTPDSRQSDRNLAEGQELMTRYAGGRGRVKFDPDEDGGAPYYHREHYLPNGNESGWYVKHYGGAHADIYHHATGDESGHDMIRFPEHPDDENSMAPRIHPDFDDISMGKALKDWHDDTEAGARRHWEDASPGYGGHPVGDARIIRWKRRYPNGRPPRPQQHEGARYESPADHPFFQANPVSKEHLKHAFYDSTPDEHEQGSRWYPDAHHVATAIAGGDSARGAGLVAAYSPRTAWPSNLFNASKAHRENRAFGGPGEGAMGMHRNLAAPIIAGVHHSEAFSRSAPKIRAFAHLIEHGGDLPEDVGTDREHVVIDRHALSAAIGRRVTDDDLSRVPLDHPRFYEHVASTYRAAARDLSADLGLHIPSHRLQATVWKRQLRLNAAEDAGQPWGGRGRNKRTENAWTRWNQHAQEHHPELGPENMHRQGAQRMAYGETRVPPQIDTLRAEECPVCGEDQVWTGQRCPVCGYVSPPDLFRDPDTSRAMQVREQLDSGDVDIPPEGQGSWPDADAQLYHPDQIAPNGVPGPDATVQDPGDGQLPQEGGEGALACPECGAQFGPEDGLAEGDPCPECGQGQLVAADFAGDEGELPPDEEMAEEGEELPPGEELPEDEEEPPEEEDEGEDDEPDPREKKRK